VPIKQLKYSQILLHTHAHKHTTRTHTRLTALCLGLPGWAGTRTVKPIWIILKQETVSGSGISWAICKPAPRSRQITTPTPHNSVFYRPYALPAAQPKASKRWRQLTHQVWYKRYWWMFVQGVRRAISGHIMAQRGRRLCPREHSRNRARLWRTWNNCRAFRGRRTPTTASQVLAAILCRAVLYNGPGPPKQPMSYFSSLWNA